MGRPSDDIKTLVSTMSPEDKVRLLRTLTQTWGELQKSGDLLTQKEWDRRVRELNENARVTSKSQVHIIESLMKDKTALSTAQIRALAASLRPRGGGSGGKGSGRGEQLWQAWIKKNEPGSDQNAADPGSRLSPADVLPTMVSDLRSADYLRMDDPARVYLTQRVLDSGVITPDELHKRIGDEAWQAYLDGKQTDDAGSARVAGAADRLEAGTFTLPDLDALKEEAIRRSEVNPDDVPMPERKPSELEKRIESQVDELSKSALSNEEPRWWGLTDSQVADLVTRPGFQRWAEAHGLTDVGSVGADGGLVVGQDTAKALRLAMRQTGKHPLVEEGGAFIGDVLHGEPEPKYIRGAVTDGKINSVWVVGDSGRIDYLDLDSGTLTEARRPDGSWKSLGLRDTYAKHVATDPTPHPYGVKGQAAWTYDQIKEHGPIDTTRESAVTNDPNELMARPAPTVELRGRLIKPTFGADPGLDATVVQPDGSRIHLVRSSVNEPWRRTEEKNNPYLYIAPENDIHLTKTKVVRRPGENDEEVPEPGAEKPAVTDAEVADFRFPGHAEKDGQRARLVDAIKKHEAGMAENMADRAAADKLTFRGPGTVEVEDEPMTPEKRAQIMHKLDADLLGAQLQEGGEAMVADAKRTDAIAQMAADEKAKAVVRPRLPIAPPATAFPEETEVPEVNSPALREAEAAFYKKLEAKEAAKADADRHDLGTETVVIRPPAPRPGVDEPADLGTETITIRKPATETVDGQEVPVRIKPRDEAAMRMDALKKARAMAAGV